MAASASVDVSSILVEEAEPNLNPAWPCGRASPGTHDVVKQETNARHARPTTPPCWRSTIIFVQSQTLGCKGYDVHAPPLLQCPAIDVFLLPDAALLLTREVCGLVARWTRPGHKSPVVPLLFGNPTLPTHPNPQYTR